MADSKNCARIFLIDDHPAVRQGLNLLLSQDSHIVCGEAGSSGETFAQIGSTGADMALLDLSLGGESGLEVIPGLRELGIAVLIYSMHEDADTISKAFAAGADGYVTKRETADVLLAAVSDVLAGRRHISGVVAQSLANKALLSPEARRKTTLSEREVEIVAMLGQGESNAEIAAAINISVRTVETYFSRIIDKLELDGMKALRRYAMNSNLQ